MLIVLALAACSETPTTSAGGQPDTGGGLKFDSKVQDLGNAADGSPAIPDLGSELMGSDGAGSDGMSTDAPLLPGQPGYPCKTGADCDSGVCLDDGDVLVCTAQCQGTCPPGWKCVESPGSGDAVFVCAPRFARLCHPCSKNADCTGAGAVGALCLPKGPLGSFCGAVCDPATSGDCPDGYACESVAGGDGLPSYQCMRKSGDCPCNATAVSGQLATACSHDNEHGSCKGERSCAGGTLSACSASVPASEGCNGKDDDCDGLTDEVDGKPACEQKNQHGVCKGFVTACDAGQAKCDAPVPAPEACNGKDDDCNGQTDEGLCEDGSACTQGQCNTDGSCQQVPLSGTPCDDGNVCTGGDQCAAGQCQGKADLACDDGNPCTADSCNPVKGCAHASQDGPCADDGNACTLDQCQSGVCKHPTAPSGTACADDGKPCTQDVCSGATCTHPATPLGQACPDDGNGCTVDTCDGKGSCSHGTKPGFCDVQGACVAAGSADPKNPCMVCQPQIASGAYTLQENAPCDDGDACSLQDVCKGGVCKGKPKDCSAFGTSCATGVCEPGTGACLAQPKPGVCNDDNPCTENDACNAGSCVGTPKNCAGLDGPCTTGQCQVGTCVAKPKTGPCNDGDACTVQDTCGNGLCIGKPMDCSGLTDACHTGQCSSGNCISQIKADGFACSDGDACTSGDACLGGKCTGTLKDCSASGDACNLGVCAGGVCGKQPKAAGVTCTDGDPCTIQDACSAGKCVGKSMDCSVMTDSCNTGVCSGGGCIAKPKTNGTVCSDGDLCTLSDVCSAGKCLGKVKDCAASGDACNDGVCLSGGVCGKKAKSSGITCSDGSPCTGNDTCQSGTCTGTPLKDGYEPNDTSPGKAIPNKSDCDDAGTLNATMSPSGDVDWFSFTASDKSFCTVKATAKLEGLAADYDVCVFFLCGNGKTGSGTVDCANGTKTSGGPSGSWGCCSANSGTIAEHAKVSPQCTTLGTGSDGGSVWIRVNPKTNTQMCGGYTLIWAAK